LTRRKKIAAQNPNQAGKKNTAKETETENPKLDLRKNTAKETKRKILRSKKKYRQRTHRKKKALCYMHASGKE
jgi:hypothetical protein